jgi:hypothetical protein
MCSKHDVCHCKAHECRLYIFVDRNLLRVDRKTDVKSTWRRDFLSLGLDEVDIAWFSVEEAQGLDPRTAAGRLVLPLPCPGNSKMTVPLMALSRRG